MAHLKDLIVNGASRFLGRIYAPAGMEGTATKAEALTTNAGSTTLPVFFENGVPKAITSYSGKATSAGTADVATKLGTTSVGSTSEPIYLNAGVPTKISYKIEKSVPSNAVFTDTTYGAEKGISLTSGKFGHSNTAVTAVTTASLKKVAYDAYGHITATSDVTKSDITALGIPGSDTNTDTKVNVTLNTTTKAYLLGTTTTPTATAAAVTSVADTGVYLDTTAGSLTATKFYASGTDGYTGKDSTNTKFTLVGHNNSNLWIGAAGSTAYHHKGGAFISTGWDGTLPTSEGVLTGKSTAYISVPKYTVAAGATTGTWSHTAYDIIHAGNYTSYVTPANIGAATSGHTHSTYVLKEGDTMTGSLALGTRNTSAVPTVGLTIQDIRNVNIGPDVGPSSAMNMFFTNKSTPDTNWWSIIHMAGWSIDYNKWEIAGPSHNSDQRTTPLYVRSTNKNTAWGNWRKIYDSSNPPTAAEVGAATSDHTHAVFTGATSSADGAKGMVPAPTKANYNTKYLRADGTWQVPPNDNTDTKVASVTTNPTSNTDYYLHFSSGNTTASTLMHNNGIKYSSREGTTTDIGRARLVLGNVTKNGTAGNKSGSIYIYCTNDNPNEANQIILANDVYKNSAQPIVNMYSNNVNNAGFGVAFGGYGLTAIAGGEAAVNYMALPILGSTVYYYSGGKMYTDSTKTTAATTYNHFIYKDASTSKYYQSDGTTVTEITAPTDYRTEKNDTERLLLMADTDIIMYTNCNTIADRKSITINTAGNLSMNGNITSYGNITGKNLFANDNNTGDVTINLTRTGGRSYQFKNSSGTLSLNTDYTYNTTSKTWTKDTAYNTPVMSVNVVNKYAIPEITLNSFIHTTGRSSSWWDGRDNAMFAITIANSNYRPLISTATSGGGSWELGNHNTENLLFTYISSAQYAAKTNPSSLAQIIFNNDGSIKATSGSDGFVIGGTANRMVYYNSSGPRFIGSTDPYAMGMTYRKYGSTETTGFIGGYGTGSNEVSYFAIGKTYDNYTMRINNDSTGKVIVQGTYPHLAVESNANSTNDVKVSVKRTDTGVTAELLVGSGGENHGLYSRSNTKWIIYQNNASITYVHTSVYNASDTAVENLVIPFFDDVVSTGYKGIRNNNGLRYSTLEGTTTSLGIARLVLGNGAGSGTANNKRGSIRLFSEGTAGIDIIPENTSSYKTITIPATNGQFFIDKKNYHIDESSDTASYPWYKMGSLSFTQGYRDRDLVFLVTSAYSSRAIGILKARSTQAGGVYDSGHLVWLTAASAINVENFVMVYKNNSPASGTLTIELWCKNTQQWNGYFFKLLEEHSRSENTYEWVPSSNVTGHGSTTYDAGNGHVISSYASATVTTNAGFYYVKGTQKASTNAWTGYIPVESLYEGLTIAYYLPYAGTSSSATLNLTLSNGNTTGAVAVYYTATSRATTHYGVGSTIYLTYYPANTISTNGNLVTSASWRRCDYNANSTTNQTLLTTNTNRPLLMAAVDNTSTASSNSSTYRNNEIFANPSTGTITSNALVLGSPYSVDSPGRKGSLTIHAGGDESLGSVTLKVDEVASAGNNQIIIPAKAGEMALGKILFDDYSHTSNTVTLTESVSEYTFLTVGFKGHNGIVMFGQCLGKSNMVYGVPLMWGAQPSQGGGTCNFTSGFIQISVDGKTISVGAKERYATMGTSSFTFATSTSDDFRIVFIYGYR